MELLLKRSNILGKAELLVKRLRKYPKKLIAAYTLDGDFASACWEAADVIEKGVWVSSEDRLPMHFVTVICYIPSLAELSLGTVHLGFLGSDEEWHIPTALTQEDKVTHWMFCPEPPKDFCPSCVVE